MASRPSVVPVARGERFLLLFGLLLVPAVVLGIEGVLALADQNGLTNSTSSGIDGLHRYSEVYGWEPRPGTYHDGSRIITINRAGYRGPEVPRSRTAGQRRVIVLGDSVAFGLYADDQETYPATLDRSNDRLEVVNLAVQGYDPGQSLLRLQRLGLSLEPDVVVLGFCLANDFADAMLPTFLFNADHPKPFFTLEDGNLVRHDAHLKLTQRERLALWLQDHSRLYRRLLPERAPEEQQQWQSRRRDATMDRGAALALVTRLVVAMRDLAASRGADFVVLLHPERPSARAQRWADEFKARLDGEGVRAVDLLESYGERGLGFEDVTLDALGHLNPVGAVATAAILEESLREPRHSRRAYLTSTSSRQRP